MSAMDETETDPDRDNTPRGAGARGPRIRDV